MVKVLSDKPVKFKTVICPKCGYELEYTGVDVTAKSIPDYGGGSDTYYFIVCPRKKCHERIFVKQY